MTAFRKLGEKEVYRGSLVSVGVASIEAPDGSRFERDVVHHPGAVVVVPVTAAGEVVMVRQYRAAVDANLLEVPAGKRDVLGEPPELTAGRELAEEVGLRAGKLVELARFYNSPGFSDELTWMYLARDLEAVASSPQGSEESHMTVERIPLRSCPGLVRSGDIADAKSIIGVSLAAAAITA